MIYSLTWLPLVLLEAGLKVGKVDGWEQRGRGEMGKVEGVICHHTGGPILGNMPSLKTLILGRSDLPGPLAQLGLGRDGAFYVIASGRCNHAGAGTWKGFNNGNANFIGIEAENPGKPTDVWPEVQMDAYRRGVAAILRHIGKSAEWCAGHKEYALPLGRKPDPHFNMDQFRTEVASILDGAAPIKPLIPAMAPAVPGSVTQRPTLRRGAFGDFVRQLQTALGIVVDGMFGNMTEVAVREFQRRLGLVPDGIVGPKTWSALDPIP